MNTNKPIASSGKKYTNKIYIALCIVLVCAIAGFSVLVYDVAGKNIREQMVNKCMGIASAISVTLEQYSDDFETFIDTLDTDSDFYKDMQSIVETTRWDNEGNIAFLYVEKRASENEMMYLFANTIHGTDVYARAGNTAPLTVTRIKAYETEEIVVGDFVTNEWGTLLSVYVPVINPTTGELMAIVGCDVSDAQYKEVMSQLLFLLSAGVIILIAFVIFLFIRLNRENAVLDNYNHIVQNAASAKSNFLANMSHEMRTPLNAIIGLSELTLNLDELKGEAAENVAKVYNSGASLLGLVNDILDLSKIEAGKFEVIPAEYDLPSTINDTVNMNIMRIGEKPIEFKLQIDETLPSMLYGDEIRVKQVFNNLLSNAFKYTEKGTVTFSVKTERDGDSVWLCASVTDSGIGIKPEHINKLFVDYNQIDAEKHRSIEGTGLGLSITKNLVKLMDGSIDVQSEYGYGSTFSVRLKQGYVNDIKIGKKVADNLINSKYFEHKRDRSEKFVRVHLPYASVLIVDDVQANLDVARGMMKPYQMKIDCVMSGKEAIERIKSEAVRYNAVFMDHMMPEMDGVEATRIIREEIDTEYARNIPIIALTANAVVGNEEMFLSKGFQAFLSKPIDIMRMDQVIRQWVRDKEYEETLQENSVKIATGDILDESAKDRRSLSDRRTVSERRADDDRRSGTDRRELENQDADIKLKEKLEHSNGIDVEAALERFDGDMSTLREVLHSFSANTRKVLPKLTDMIDNKEDIDEAALHSYAIEVHGIKGSSRGICAESIGAMAESLEHAAKDGNIQYVRNSNKKLIAGVTELLDEIDGVLEEFAVSEVLPLKLAPSKEELKKLADAAAAFDMDGATKILDEIFAYDYEEDKDLILWLKGQAELMDLDEIATGLSERI